MFENVDWTEGAAHMWAAHGVSVDEADEALRDPDRVVITPDYNSRSGDSSRIIGFSATRMKLLSIIVVVNDGTEYGASGWPSNSMDRRIYREGGKS